VTYYAYADTVDSASECEYPLAWEQALLAGAKVIALEKIDSPMLPLAIQERDKILAALFQSETLKPQMTQVGK
jgi:hypothetical protein